MGDTIQANYKTLEEIDAKVYQVYENVDKHVIKIASLLQDLDKHWQGEAADSFVRDSSNFRQSFNKLNLALLDASYKASDIAKILRAAEEEAGQKQKGNTR